MRKIYIISLLTIFSSCAAFTQTILLDTAQIHIGTSHGVTGSMIFFNPNVDVDILFGYNGGIMARYITQKGRGLQIELNFSQRGWQEKNSLYAKQLNYIELPILTHIYIGNKSRFFFNLGPKISYLISQKVIQNNTTEKTSSYQHTNDIKRPFDYGVTAGLGYQLNIKKQSFYFEARANFSLSSIYANSARDYFKNSHNVNVAANLGWSMRVK